MDHTLTHEQRLVGDTAQELFLQHFPVSALRQLIDGEGVSKSAVETLGASGLIGVCAPATIDGGELGALGALQIVIAAANCLVPFPVSESIVAAALLGTTHPDIARETITAQTTVVFGASQAAPIEGGNGRLCGTLRNVPSALTANCAIAQANLPSGPAHVLVDLGKPGVSRVARKSIDPGYPLGEIVLEEVAIDENDIIGPIVPEWERLRMILAAGELLGAARACLSMAVDYMKVRKQFGQEIGRFQALKHIAANGALSIDCMHTATEYAAWAHDARDDEAEMFASIAKTYASDHARRVAEDALQCHGAIGFTWDYDLHLYLRRILRLGASAGTAAEHRESIAEMLGKRLAAEEI
ncbi:acyl-CoA dehydrogenase [Caballeronia sp. LZ001]|uniref:acyl-CoA dehydrogenase family protein n=1 Tax=Caballeronia sp. LZ001 TaxID=3038553 RepID=UPI002862CFD6|nr:acyl-CoA dehydrogenase [Caballeronia sp. LZ001]MDR5804824.1 acyl-CoA dehydrogenase [Caballeronia sp. LZ001]